VPVKAVGFFLGVVRGVDCEDLGAGFLDVVGVVRVDETCFDLFGLAWFGFPGSFAGRVCSRKVKSFLYTLGAHGGRA
jgi:hypothetical protein